MINLDTTQIYRNRTRNKNTFIKSDIKYVKFFPKRFITANLHKDGMYEYKNGKADLRTLIVLVNYIFVDLVKSDAYKELSSTYRRLMRPVRRKAQLLKPQDYLLSLNFKIVNYD